MNLQTIEIKITDRQAVVTLNRPDVRNAFHPTMINELTAVFHELAKNEKISSVLLKGNGKSFCSGADLSYMQSMAGFSFNENMKDALALHEMFSAIRNCPHPVLGRLHGHVMGGGLGLAAACDVNAAVDGTQFCFSEVRLGIAPAVISPFALEKMQSSYARRYMLSGEVFDSAEALASGLVHFSGAETAVDDFLGEMSHTFDMNGVEAVRATKNLLRQLAALPDWNDKKALTTKTIAERRVSAEGQEGLKSFLEKRPPTWRPVKK